MKLFREAGPIVQNDAEQPTTNPNADQPGTSKQLHPTINPTPNPSGISQQLVGPVSLEKPLVSGKLEVYEFDFNRDKNTPKQVPDLGEIIPTDELTHQFLDLKKKNAWENFTFKE